MKPFICKTDELRTIQLLIGCPKIQQLYFVPFAILYSIWFTIWATKIGIDDHIELGFIGLGIIIILHVLFSLFSYWSLAFRIFVKYKRTNDSSLAEFVHVTPKDNNGIAEIVPIKVKLENSALKNRKFFIFQRLQYYLDEEERCVTSPQFPLNHKFGVYAKHRGYEEENDALLAISEYGTNILTHELPSFMSLFVERATAPFFCFQIFCVLLWCLDEYWAYPMVTLGMLVLYEVNLCAQQRHNMKTIQSMETKPYLVLVYRCKRWTAIHSKFLVPGDIVSIPVSKEDHSIPCDLLILKGSCIVNESMLTGESVPVIKDSIDVYKEDDHFEFNNTFKNVILFGGTKVMQTTLPEKYPFPKPSDNGCICYVLRTGLSTSQGSLLRTIMFSVKTVTANNFETFLFIVFLLCFALAAAVYVWIEGSKDPKRNKYKLFIECTVILTSVIPQELPIELSMAVNSSLLALSKYAIFCTEPFRIPFAGKVDICCFDKTGTLTEDSVIVEGVSGLPDKPTNEIVSIKDCPIETITVLVTAHSLALTDNGIVGDPLEKSVLEWAGWSLNRDGSIFARTLSKMESFKIYNKFSFTSSLRRMSVICGQQAQSSPEMVYYGCVKGSPEVIKTMLTNAPADYDENYLTMVRRGARVLALAYKDLGSISRDKIRNMEREELERDLKFAGFIILSCPLKKQSIDAVVRLKESSHHVTMITGDNPLTACFVGQLLSIANNDTPVLVLTQNSTLNNWEWRSVDDAITIPMNFQDTKETMLEISRIHQKHDLCITGGGLEMISNCDMRILDSLLPKTRIFARMAPDQKESIICGLKRLNYTVMMCGDGTNDVGALKHSHVGVSIINSQTKQEKTKPKAKQVEKQPTDPDADRHLTPQQIHLRNMKRKREELIAQAMKSSEEEEKYVVKMGDASIAAPFIIKTANPMGVCRIIEQGRCTLVITLQMFKILAINALISAYSLSILFLKGFKPSDLQTVFQVFLLSGSFLFISRSQPLKRLSKERPLPNIFNIYTIGTVTIQFLIHFYVLTTVVYESELRMPKLKENEFIDLTAEFQPSIFNTCVYLISTAMQATTLMVNYKGNPFMISFFDNKPLFYSIMVALFGVFFLSLGLGAEQLSLVTMEPDLQYKFQQMFFFDLFGCLIVDRVLSFLFGYANIKNL